MNLFAFNEAAINSQPSYDIALEGSADVVLFAEGDVIVRKLAEGEIAAQLTATGNFSTGVLVEGDSQIQFSTEAEAYKRSMMQGNVLISLSTTGSGHRGSLLEGTAPIVLTATADAIVRQTILRLEGVIGMSIDGLVDGRRTPAHRPEANMSINLDMVASAWLEMHGNEGAAEIEMLLSAGSRLGARVYIEGESRVEFIAHVDGRRYAQVRLEGLSEIELSLVAQRAGRPLIPTEYIQAPQGRQFTVARDTRERRIFDDRRL